ncbi:MAG: MFS transporter, partial [Spirochaetota bacterium]
MKDFLTSRSERLSYGSFFLGQNIIFTVVTSYLMLFYTDVMGIAAISVATLFLIARVWDAVNDPILGSIVDKADLKKGKFLPWINSTVFLLPVVTIILFIDPKWGESGNLVYAYITYILWGMVYTVSDVPIFALATVLTDKGNERVALISIGRIFAGIASLVMAAITFPLIKKLGWWQ